MNTDAELDVWRLQWQSEAAVPLDLRSKVARQSLLMKIGLIADTIVTVVMGGGTTAWALRSPGPDIVLVAAATWLFLAAAWTFVLTANRGNWAPSASDTAGFLDLSVRRCRTALNTIWFAAVLFVCEIAFSLGWAYQHIPGHRKPLLAWLWFGSLRVDIVWLCTLAFFGAMAWYRGKKRAELTCLLDLRGEMSAPTTDASNSWEARSWAWDRWQFRGRGRRSKKKREV